MIAVGNILGSPRAEADYAMLSRAFIETAEFRACVETQDFNYVVGRRGAGKSALFARVKEHYERRQDNLTLAAKPAEHDTLSIQKLLIEIATNYNEMRAIARVAWKVHILFWTLSRVLSHYKASKAQSYETLSRLAIEHKALLHKDTIDRCADIIRAGVDNKPSPREIPGRIAASFQLAHLQDSVQELLSTINRKVVVLYDGLDEGWIPESAATSVLGGLSLAIADLDESQSGIHGTLFIRDNMFRALAHFDTDFSRHIEGHALRLHWDEDSLLQLVGTRLRIALNLGNLESVVRVWNRFTAGDLQDRSGFESCLHHTLYRPRDILVLLNRAYVHASRQGRDRITKQDIEKASTSISQDRFDDLLKEYDSVLPGLATFVKLFHSKAAIIDLGSVVTLLDEAIGNDAYEDERSSDFALLGSGKQALQALYGVGFLGFKDKLRGGYAFCHDGSRSELDLLDSTAETLVHPCYWKALSIDSESTPESLLIQVNDEYETSQMPDVKDIRTKQLGQIIAELPRVQLGKEGDNAFEDWVFRAVKILFAGKLSNPELKPNSGAIQQRDIVATNMADTGFWKRIREDYNSRQVVFEVKNYEAIKLDDYRQVLSYTTNEYGKFAVIVNRSNTEGVSETEKGWIREFYHTHQRLLLPVPVSIIVRCLSKLRNAKRFDYTEDILGKRMDTFVRSYLSLKHVIPFGNKKQRAKAT